MNRPWTLLLLAWLVATTATLGALFIGEVMGMTPCVLCWYQRIFMFPLAIILGIACFIDDRRGAVYGLTLALGGLAMADKVQARLIEFAYGLDLGMARRWGLYISASKGKTSIGLEEPALFSEPGVFLIKPDQTLYYGSTQTMPFARPSFSDLLAAVDFAIQKDYPARGEYTGGI